jgi:2-oxoisovalerate dehydrogenase E1 component beta subunit
MNLVEAIRDAHVVAMERDETVVVFGEDVGFFGGVFRCTQGLQERFGTHRCFDTPISESGIVGAAIGMATNGLRPCVEIQFADYMYPAYDQIVSEAARLRHRSAGDFTAPITVRMPTGGGIFGGQTHSQSPEALFTHVAGLTTIVPSNPYDAKGLLLAAIESPDPVMFLEPKRLYHGAFTGRPDDRVLPWKEHELGDVPDGHYTIPIGEAAIRREGSALTIVAYGTMVHVAATAVTESGIDAEIIDLRSLVPLDIDLVVASVERTGRCIVLHEATRTSGFGAELAALIQSKAFFSLEAPVRRVTGWDTPYPHAQEWDYFPGPDRVIRAMEETLAV